MFTYLPLNFRILKNRKRIRKKDILKSLYRGFPRIVHAPIGPLMTEYPEKVSSFELHIMAYRKNILVPGVRNFWVHDFFSKIIIKLKKRIKSL